MLAPQSFIDQLLHRADNYIGILELLAVVMALSTFEDMLRGNLWSAYVDNDGVMHSLLRGRGLGSDGILIVGNFWLAVSVRAIYFHAYRVESKANIADGPTRGDTQMVHRLNAQWRDPVLPGWVWTLWGMPLSPT